MPSSLRGPHLLARGAVILLLAVSVVACPAAPSVLGRRSRQTVSFHLLHLTRLLSSHVIATTYP
jgi:hypothetical protein